MREMKYNRIVKRKREGKKGKEWMKRRERERKRGLNVELYYNVEKGKRGGGKYESIKRNRNKLEWKKARRERWRIRHGAPTDTFSDGLNILIAKLRNAYYSAD